MRAGKHAFVEKPIATSLSDAVSMIRTASETGAVLAVGENVPFRQDVNLAMSLLPRIGRPRTLHAVAYPHISPQGWRRERQSMGGGVLMDSGVHLVRLLRLIFGEPECVFAVRAPQCQAMEGEDNGLITLQGQGQSWNATISVGWSAGIGRHPEFLILGENGALKLWPDGNFVDLYDRTERSLKERLFSCVRPWWLKERLIGVEHARHRYRIHGGDMGCSAQLGAFLSNVISGKPDINSATNALKDLSIITAAYESLNTGLPVFLKAKSFHETAPGLSYNGATSVHTLSSALCAAHGLPS